MKIAEPIAIEQDAMLQVVSALSIQKRNIIRV